MKLNKKVILLILDGWGLGKKDKFNAIDNANTPNFDRLVREYPNVQLRADGPYVGLPEGQFGTSEINHQAIGAGRITLQDLPRINTAIENGEFFTNPFLLDIIEHVKQNNSALHLVGIISDGKVHSDLEHLITLIKMARKEGVKKLFIHAFTDGRDTPPQSAEEYFNHIQPHLTGFEQVAFATMQGRFWLDRDRDWEKTSKAIDLITKGKGQKVTDWQAAINFSYNQKIKDEFFEQFVIDETGLIKENDGVIFTHYRTDRIFQIIKALLAEKLENLKVATFIEVSEDFKVSIAFPRPVIKHTLAETLAEADKTQFHLTETEKYTHLTFFFNGGREKEYKGEEWQLVQSNRFVKPFYNLEPTMQSFAITKEIIKKIEENKTDFMVVNFASPDMVGHTGKYEAAVISAEAVDHCLGKIYEALSDKLDDYVLLVTADHGNSEEMWDYESDQPHTQHTTNPVPFILVSNLKAVLHRRDSLQDIAPTILELMGVKKPELMTGESLLDYKKR